jgi:phage-related tail protein
MTEPVEIVPKLLDLKHQNQVRRLSAVMAEIRLIERKQNDLIEERKKLDQESDGFARISLQNGYGRYLQARDEALAEQAAALRDKAAEIQKNIKETMCSQSILREEDSV